MKSYVVSLFVLSTCAVAAAAIALVPNILWLFFSTISIRNESGSESHSVSVGACGGVQKTFDLEPKRSQFLFLDACGDDDIRIQVDQIEQCLFYSGPSLYHFIVTIDPRSGKGKIHCRISGPLEGLFLFEYMR